MEVAVTEPSATPGAAPVAELPPDWGTVLPTADVAAGENISKRCLQCHDFDQRRAATRSDPISGASSASITRTHADYAYSAAMKALADKTWDYDELNAFLTNPKAVVPGTKMAFAGLSKQNDRINLIAWLRTKSDSPSPIPAPNRGRGAGSRGRRHGRRRSFDANADTAARWRDGAGRRSANCTDRRHAAGDTWTGDTGSGDGHPSAGADRAAAASRSARAVTDTGTLT